MAVRLSLQNATFGCSCRCRHLESCPSNCRRKLRQASLIRKPGTKRACPMANSISCMNELTSRNVDLCPHEGDLRRLLPVFYLYSGLLLMLLIAQAARLVALTWRSIAQAIADVSRAARQALISIL